jgi:DNA-binding NarL/FixJ family response regulator
MTIRVVVADDQPLIAAGLGMLLSQEPDVQVVAMAADGAAAVAAAREHRPDVVVMDVRMPGMDGIEATKVLLAPGTSTPAPQVLFVATVHDERLVYAALRAGAAGFVLKDAAPGDLIRAVRVCAAGHGWLDPLVTRRLLAELAARPESGARPLAELRNLTPREREVLALLAQGYSNTDLSRLLFISQGTVKTHMTRVLMKLGLRTRAEAVAVAFQSGLVTVSRPS